MTTKLFGALVIAGTMAAFQARAQCQDHHHCPAHYGSGSQGAGCQGAGCWSATGPYGKMYDPKTVETVKGEVMSVEKFAPAKGMSSGVHLLVRTGKETISVHLGPSWYLENQDAQVEPKDTNEITGSRLTVDGKAILIATEVRQGDAILKLRDEKGIPLWAGWRKR